MVVGSTVINQGNPWECWVSFIFTSFILYQILSYFGARVEEKMDTVSTAEGIISVIKEATETWPKDNIKVS